MLDTYQLKSLDGFLDIDLNHVKFIKINEKYYLTQLGENYDETKHFNELGYDKVIRCLGFKFDFDIFNRLEIYRKFTCSTIRKFKSFYFNSSMKISKPNGRLKKYPLIFAFLANCRSVL